LYQKNTILLVNYILPLLIVPYSFWSTQHSDGLCTGYIQTHHRLLRAWNKLDSQILESLPSGKVRVRFDVYSIYHDEVLLNQIQTQQHNHGRPLFRFKRLALTGTVISPKIHGTTG